MSGSAVAPVVSPIQSPIISIDGLEKSYGKVRALRGLTLELEPGPTGLLGPNGSGKTTLIKLLLGLLRPDAGRASIAGCDPTSAAGRLALRRSVGYMPESDCLIGGLSGLEIVATLGRLTGLARADALSRSHEVLDYVEIHEARYRLADEYSSGMKQRLKLAQALVHDPSLLLLDEPTSGLDPQGRRHMLDLVHDLGHVQGKSLLVCSHLLPDIERTCRDVVVLHNGSVALAGSIDELTRIQGLRVRVEVGGDRARFENALGASGFSFVPEAGGRLTVRLDGRAEDADLLFAIAAGAGASLRSVEEVRSSLEQVFVAGLAAEEPE